jgi:hypothetical protein
VEPKGIENQLNDRFGQKNPALFMRHEPKHCPSEKPTPKAPVQAIF